jgi:hypothetical protein
MLDPRFKMAADPTPNAEVQPVPASGSAPPSDSPSGDGNRATDVTWSDYDRRILDNIRMLESHLKRLWELRDATFLNLKKLEDWKNRIDSLYDHERSKTRTWSADILWDGEWSRWKKETRKLFNQNARLSHIFKEKADEWDILMKSVDEKIESASHNKIGQTKDERTLELKVIDRSLADLILDLGALYDARSWTEDKESRITMECDARANALNKILVTKYEKDGDRRYLDLYHVDQRIRLRKIRNDSREAIVLIGNMNDLFEVTEKAQKCMSDLEADQDNWEDHEGKNGGHWNWENPYVPPTKIPDADLALGSAETDFKKDKKSYILPLGFYKTKPLPNQENEDDDSASKDKETNREISRQRHRKFMDDLIKLDDVDPLRGKQQEQANRIPISLGGGSTCRDAYT